MNFDPNHDRIFEPEDEQPDEEIDIDADHFLKDVDQEEINEIEERRYFESADEMDSFDRMNTGEIEDIDPLDRGLDNDSDFDFGFPDDY